MVLFKLQLNAGNLVRIEGGCATVWGYKLPDATVQNTGRRKPGLKPQARIPVLLCSSRLALPISFSVKEKDEARVLFLQDLVNAFIPALREDGGFCSSSSALVSKKNRAQAQTKDQCMQKIIIIGLALASVFNSTRGDGFADSVLSYNPGTGFATEFGSGLGFTNSAAALGEPSRVTPGTFGGPVDPFNAPYLRDQVVSIGTGGSLTVQFNSPLPNNPSNPHGLDFVIFGNAGFVIVNGDYSGGGITDGSLYASNEGGITRVSISSDGLNYYQLDPALAPTVDQLFPTDGSGNFHLPVDPSLKNDSFNGLGLDGIRALYNGSGGGTGFDISWARNSQGQPVDLDSIQYVRVDVLNGASEIDGFSIVPEPGTWAFILLGGIALLWRKLG